MKKDFHCKYSILDTDVICEHKFARIDFPFTSALHNHDGYEILLFLGGTVEFHTESERKKLERGDLIFIRPYSFHGIGLTDIDSYERIVINVREDYLRRISLQDTDLSSCFFRTPAGNLNLIQLSESSIAEFLHITEKVENNTLHKPYGYKILETAYFSECMVMLNQLAVSNPRLPAYTNIMPNIVAETFKYIEDNLTKNITIGKMALQLHHNSDYLSHVFKSVTGCSLQYYIIAKRISLAQIYLREGKSPYDVCFESGFNNYSSFSRAFSRQIGCSPKQYQQEYQTRNRTTLNNDILKSF